jgi:Sulfotransferase domain
VPDPPPLPTFLVVGAMRSGTTSLYRYLQAHPQVHIPRKEIHFFDRRFDRGLDWYRSRFEGWSGEPAIGEATPTYMYEPEAVARIAEVLPEVRVVAMLRNPVDRAYSHYWMEHARGRDPRTFEEAVEAELGGDGSDYLERGRYLPQLERLEATFGRARVHVALLEDLERSPGSTYAETCRFLDVDDQFRPDDLGRRVNRFVRFRSMRVRAMRRSLPQALGIGRIVGRLNAASGGYPPVDPALRVHLVARFAPERQALAVHLGRELPGWDQ